MVRSERDQSSETEDAFIQRVRADVFLKLDATVTGLRGGEALTSAIAETVKKSVQAILELRRDAHTALAKRKLVLLDEKPHQGTNTNGTDPGSIALSSTGGADGKVAEIVVRAAPSKVQISIEVPTSTPSQ